MGGIGLNQAFDIVVAGGGISGLSLGLSAGSGIPTALASGSIAGEVAAQHLKEGSELSIYADA